MSNTAYSLSFSMNDCRGKTLALFYHLRQHRCGCFLLLFCYFFHSDESPEVSSIVLFLDMTPVGRAPQTKHWAAPALTHGENRGWLQWIKSWTPLPLPKTTRRYHNKTVLKDENLYSTFLLLQKFLIHDIIWEGNQTMFVKPDFVVMAWIRHCRA